MNFTFLRFFVLLGFICLIVTGCNQETSNPGKAYEFTGESGNWTADFIVQENEDEVERKLSITYKGSIDELQTTNQVEFGYNTGDYSGMSTRKFNGDSPRSKTYTIEEYHSSELSIDKTDNIEITVKWNDKTEQFTLKSL